MIAPYKITELYPINALYWRVHEYNVQPFWTTQSSCIYKIAGKPEVVDAAVCNTQLFPMQTLVWILW